MRRAGLLAALLAGLAGCGGSPDAPDERRPAPERRPFAGDLRSVDARSPLVPAAGSGRWRCPTEGRMQLAISAQGEVALSIGGRLLASVSTARPLVNRDCDRTGTRRPGAARGFADQGRVGAGVLACRAPAVVVVDFAGGDLSVRSPDGRLLAAAAVNPERAAVASYWSEGCAPV